MEDENCGTQPEQCETPDPSCRTLVGGSRPPELAPTPRHRMAHVKKVANGFIVEIKCSQFVAKNWEEASTGLADYWKDPRAAQKKYMNL